MCEIEEGAISLVKEEWEGSLEEILKPDLER